MTCQRLTDRAFVDYWCGELDAAESESLEDHIFGCSDCELRAEALAGTAICVRDATRLGGVSSLTLTRSAIERLEEDGVPLRHYVVHRGETVACQATADHFSVVHLRLDRPVPQSRIDLGIETATGHSIHCKDVSINHRDGEISLAWPGDMVRAQPTGILSLRVTESEGASPRALGEYKLSHTASEHA